MSLADVAAALQGDSEAKLLAGGQTLLASMKLGLMAPSQLIDLGSLPELSGVRRTREGLSIGAMTRHVEVSESEEVRRTIPALAGLAAGIGDRMVRNRGTLGGSVANNDPAADYPAAVLGLGAIVVTDRREIPADSFFLGTFDTALEPSEVITRVVFPSPRRAAYMKFKSQASRFAVVGVFVADTQGGVRVAVTGAGAGVFRVAAMEAALTAQFDTGSVDGIDVDPDTVSGDAYYSAQYRSHLVSVLAKRAVHACLAS
jgi:carbon-monoxide dehydrogenase medium subunit